MLINDFDLNASQILYMIQGAADDVKKNCPKTYTKINNILKDTSPDFFDKLTKVLKTIDKSSRKQILPSLGKFSTLEETIATDVVNANLNLWSSLRKYCEITAVKSAISLCATLATDGSLKEKEFRTDFDLAQVEKNFNADQRQFKPVQNHVNEIIKLLRD